MIAKDLSAMWEAIAPALGNHLWQSTLFAIAAGLLTLILRKNHARARYWLWLTASVKFLIPFSLLVGVGRQLAWLRGSAGPNESVFFLMGQVGQPFKLAGPVVSEPATLLSVASRFLPIFFLAVWLCGSLIVLGLWARRWRRVTAATRDASHVNSGREFDTLRHLEQSLCIPKPIKLLASESSLEPGIVGIFSPAMLLPRGIAERLSDKELAAILTHELCHVRRCDNLAAAIHMLVEVIFWFHPLLWWIGAKLVEERERACDEEVLRLGSEPQIYAEGILKICEFYLESPLVCAAGVTGSNLKRRIEEIMNHRVAGKLELGKKLVLAAIAATAVVGPLAIGVMNPIASRAQGTSAAPAVFENVSITRKGPSGLDVPVGVRKLEGNGNTEFVWTNTSLAVLTVFAYNFPRWSQTSEWPAWMTSEKYDISAKVNSTDDTEIRLALQKLLADRFELAVHRETKEVPVYELVVASGGPRLSEVHPEPVSSTQANKLVRMNSTIIANPFGHVVARQAPVAALLGVLDQQTGRVVLDKTGLTGVYDFNLDWTTDSPNAIVAALHEQLGLDLKPQTAPVEMLLIDRVEQPDLTVSENLTIIGTNPALNMAERQVDNAVLSQSGPSTPVRVSKDVMQGLIQEKVPPQYPEAAKKDHVQGTVVLAATIGKDGNVENLQIISGDPMLAPAAIEAVKQWKYKPYMQSGKPVEVETDLEVDFTLSPE